MTGELERFQQQQVAVRNMIRAQEDALAELMPRTGVTPRAFMGFAVEAVQKDQYVSQIAAQNPGSLMSTLMKCAMLGHVPGSQNFAIVAFGGNNPAVTGIEQYHGVIDRAQRAAPGLVVAASIVRQNDTFKREPALGESAVHWYPPFASAEERGSIIGVYAQARLPEGTYTQSVTLNPEQIAKYKAMSKKEKYGQYKDKSRFWELWPEEMASKCAILRLRGLPQSSEYIRELGALHVKAERISAQIGAPMPDLNEQAEFDGDPNGVIDVED